MSIGEFSERSGLSPKRLRTYAASGLLTPAAVDPASGYRYYETAQVDDARLIDVLRRTGLPLSEIGSLLRHPSLERFDSLATSIETEMGARRRALDTARRTFAVGVESIQHPAEPDIGDRRMATLQTAHRTETGPVRENNEDSVVTSDRLIVVADGMGGPPGGEVASAIAVALTDAAFEGTSQQELEAGARAANRAICDRAASDSHLRGMGSTLCALGLLDDGRVAVVNVGDTRAYLVRDGSLTQLSHDHSVTAELVRRGELTEEESRVHAYRGVLTRALGVGPIVEIESATYPLASGDRLVVCTDGLTNEVAAEEIRNVAVAVADPLSAVDGLVELALSRDARDNVTVVVANVAFERECRSQ
jgi:PPM family protein phosphatase